MKYMMLIWTTALLSGCAALGWEKTVTDPATGTVATEFDPAAAQATLQAAQSAMESAGLDGGIVYALFSIGGIALGYWAKAKAEKKKAQEGDNQEAISS